MILDGERLYQVLERCPDLFPEWKKEGNEYWNFKTGEIITKDGHIMHDLVYRGDTIIIMDTLKDIIENPAQEYSYLYPINN